MEPLALFLMMMMMPPPLPPPLLPLLQKYFLGLKAACAYG
jgi:hypothetical protein